MNQSTPTHVSRSEAKQIFNAFRESNVRIVQVQKNNYIDVMINKTHLEENNHDEYKHHVIGDRIFHFKTIGNILTHD